MSATKDNTERVLRLLASHGPSKAKDLVRPGLAQATVYRAIETLKGRELVIPDEQGAYAITKKGSAWLEARNEAVEVAPELPVPALDHAPSALHRSFMTIGLCMTCARWHGVNDRSYGALVAIGESGGFKTTGGEAVVVLAGGDTSKDVVDISSEAGKGLLVRRDARGEELFRSHLLEVPVAVFDEADKIDDAKVKSTLETVYLSGKPTVASEGSPIPIRCTSIVTMNPVNESGASFNDLTGFHSSRDRRVIVARFPRITIKREQDQKEEEFWLKTLIKEDRTRTTKLPPPRNPGLRVAGRFRAISDLIIRDPGIASRVDEHVLNNIARGATAWLDDERAVRLVAFHWGRLAASNGHCHEDWEERLAMHFAPKAARRARRDAKVLKRSRRLYAAVKEALDGDFDRAIKVIEREGAEARAEPEVEASDADLLKAARSGLKDGVPRAIAVILNAIDLEQKGHSIATAVDLERRRSKLALRRAEAFDGLDLRARLKAKGLSSAVAERLAELAHARGFSVDDAAYAFELGAVLVLMGYRHKHLDMLARRAPLRA